MMNDKRVHDNQKDSLREGGPSRDRDFLTLMIASYRRGMITKPQFYQLVDMVRAEGIPPELNEIVAIMLNKMQENKEQRDGSKSKKSI